MPPPPPAASARPAPAPPPPPPRQPGRVPQVTPIPRARCRAVLWVAFVVSTTEGSPMTPRDLLWAGVHPRTGRVERKRLTFRRRVTSGGETSRATTPCEVAANSGRYVWIEAALDTAPATSALKALGDVEHDTRWLWTARGIMESRQDAGNHPACGSSRRGSWHAGSRIARAGEQPVARKSISSGLKAGRELMAPDTTRKNRLGEPIYSEHKNPRTAVRGLSGEIRKVTGCVIGAFRR